MALQESASGGDHMADRQWDEAQPRPNRHGEGDISKFVCFLFNLSQFMSPTHFSNLGKSLHIFSCSSTLRILGSYCPNTFSKYLFTLHYKEKKVCGWIYPGALIRCMENIFYWLTFSYRQKFGTNLHSNKIYECL